MSVDLEQRKRAEQERNARRAWVYLAWLISYAWALLVVALIALMVAFHGDFWWILGLGIAAVVIVVWVRFDPPRAFRPTAQTEGARIVANWRDIAIHAGLVSNVNAVTAQISGYGRATAVDVLRRKAKLREALAWIETEFRATIGGAYSVPVVPFIADVSENDFSVTVNVEPLPGDDIDSMRRRADALTLAARVDSVRVETGDFRGVVKIVFIFGDSLASRKTPVIACDLSSPSSAPRRKLPDVSIGTMADGNPWTLPLAVHSLIGGVTGSGKSVTLNAALCEIEKLDYAQLALIDMKAMLELGPHSPRAYRVAGDHESAADLLEELCAIMDSRLAAMRSAGVRFWGDMPEGFSPDNPLIVVVVDEVAELFAKPPGDAKSSKELAVRIETALSRLARLSRAAGFCIILATQKPTTDAIPSHIRDNVSARFCGRVTTSEQGKAILGATDPAVIEAATRIGVGQKGYFVTMTPTGWEYALADFLTDSQVAEVVASTTQLRKDSFN